MSVDRPVGQRSGMTPEERGLAQRDAALEYFTPWCESW